jgi:cytochrome c oxidase cbb3-type subunit 3
LCPIRWALWLGISIGLASAAQSQHPNVAPQSETEATIKTGRALFRQDCAFCHGRDAGGGETGPDLTSSQLVASDLNGNKIMPVVRQGRPLKGMPAFNLSQDDLSAIVAFIHYQRDETILHPGGRRRVSASDLSGGNVRAGERYFNGVGGCASCHSPTGDLAGIGRKLQALRLEEEMLYPRNAKAKVTVTLPSGQTLSGTLDYKDEFVLGMVDANGWYHSWPINTIQYKIDDPAEAHVRLLSKYTDDDIHNLVAYLMTLK